jgi:hypothetical protein
MAERSRAEIEQAHATRAVEEALKTVTNARVGAVITRGASVLTTGYKGEIDGLHAEQVALVDDARKLGHFDVVMASFSSVADKACPVPAVYGHSVGQTLRSFDSKEVNWPRHGSLALPTAPAFESSPDSRSPSLSCPGGSRGHPGPGAQGVKTAGSRADSCEMCGHGRYPHEFARDGEGETPRSRCGGLSHGSLVSGGRRRDVSVPRPAKLRRPRAGGSGPQRGLRCAMHRDPRREPWPTPST